MYTRTAYTMTYVHTRLARPLEHVHNSSTCTPPGALLDVYDARSMYTMRRGLWYTRYTTGTRAHKRPHGSGFRDGIPRVNSGPETHSMEPPPRTTQDESISRSLRRSSRGGRAAQRRPMRRRAGLGQPGPRLVHLRQPLAQIDPLAIVGEEAREFA